MAGLSIGLGVSFPDWQMFGESLCQVRTPRKVVALTFDDGPDPENTPALLTLLARLGVRATFFCVGQRVACHPELAARMVVEGHEVENHSFQHHRWTNFFSVPRLRGDLARAQMEIARATSRVPQFYRPPMGLTNQSVFRVADELGLRVTGYSARGFDQRTDSPGEIVTRVLGQVRSGTIIMLHDGGVPMARLTTVVTMLIDNLRADGYECLRLDELLTCESAA
jgi:peptidoglycan/xylan/chitin deacetylase (PgdA/CDA1 family)